MDIVIPIIVGIAVGVASAFTTARLAFRRFRKEKLWKHKHEAYIRLLEAFHNMDVSMRKICLDEALGRDTGENLKRYSMAHGEEVVYANNVAKLILPKSATNLIEGFREQHREIVNSDRELQAQYEQLVPLIKSHVDEIVIIAQNDLYIH